MYGIRNNENIFFSTATPMIKVALEITFFIKSFWSPSSSVTKLRKTALKITLHYQKCIFYKVQNKFLLKWWFTFCCRKQFPKWYFSIFRPPMSHLAITTVRVRLKFETTLLILITDLLNRQFFFNSEKSEVMAKKKIWISLLSRNTKFLILGLSTRIPTVCILIKNRNVIVYYSRIHVGWLLHVCDVCGSEPWRHVKVDYF